MTRTDARQWLNIFSDTPEELRHVCENGHKDCSISPEGACLDEVIKIAIPPDA